MKHICTAVCFLLTVAMLCALCACGGDPIDTPTVTIPTEPVETTTTTQTTQAPSAVNMITGVNDMGNSTLTRPVGIMVANNDFIQDEQVGLGKADMWVEAETEGGITRIMAVFANTERVPDSIGPVRSARTPFFRVVEALGLAYVHAGGSYTALNAIASSNIADLDVNADENGGDYSWRDSSYPHDYEYRLRTNGEMLTKYMDDCDYKTYAVTEFPWTFGEQSGETAQNIDIVMSSVQKIGFDYDSETGLYQKTNGSYENEHYDSDSTPIAAKTVLVLYTDKYWENDTTIDFYLQSGKGYVFSDGVMRRFDWTRDGNGFTMNEEDGSKLTIGEGKVYMCIASTNYASSISYQ